MVSVLFVVIEDLLHRLNTGIVVTLIVLSRVLLVPVKDLKNACHFRKYTLDEMYYLPCQRRARRA
jgi:hypothetical protein